MSAVTIKDALVSLFLVANSQNSCPQDPDGNGLEEGALVEYIVDALKNNPTGMLTYYCIIHILFVIINMNIICMYIVDILKMHPTLQACSQLLSSGKISTCWGRHGHL